MGLIYESGRGVEKDGAAAAVWYRLAAGQGDVDALFRLGILYGGTQGIEPDNVEAYKWFSLAKRRGNASAASRMLLLWIAMSSEEIAQAERLAEDWREAHPAAE
jgi:TPR repeat protein